MLWCFPTNNSYASSLCETKAPIDLEHAISLFPIMHLGDLTMMEVVWVKCDLAYHAREIIGVDFIALSGL